MLSASRPAIGAAALAAVVAGCGDRGHRAPASAAAAEPAAIRLTCDDSWIPNRRTFAAREWRRNSIRLGPLTLLNARRLRWAPDDVLGELKIRTLMRPGASARLSLERTAPARAAFAAVPITARRRVVEFPGCVPVPADQRTFPDLGDRGFPLILAAPGPGCYDIAVTAGATTIRHRLKVGVRRCAAA